MKRLLRASALLALLLVAKCPTQPKSTEQTYEDPAQCECRRVGKVLVCNSACPPGHRP